MTIPQSGSAEGAGATHEEFSAMRHFDRRRYKTAGWQL
jgi:hypothetical protein